jgi:hypothetical protein
VINKLVKQLILAICVASVLPSVARPVKLSDGTNVELLSIGLAKELREETYIGSIYAPAGIESVHLLKSPLMHKRIVIQSLVDNYPFREVKRHIKERIVMNNPREQLPLVSNDVIRFTNLFNQNLIKGDEIRLDS